MNTGIRVMRQFLVWLLAGTAAGIFLAAVLSVHEYRTLADISGAVMQSRSLEEGMKKGSEAFRE